jgi:hypothetical protein
MRELPSDLTRAARNPGAPDRQVRAGETPAVRIEVPWVKKRGQSWGTKTAQNELLTPKPVLNENKYTTLAEVKIEDESTQIMTVTIQANLLIAAQALGIFGGPVSALVEWGTFGATFSAVVDVFSGTQFSIAASWCRVSCINEAFLNPNTSQKPVGATASISLLPITKARSATKTMLAVINPVGSGVIFGLEDSAIAAGAAFAVPIQEFDPPFSPSNLLFAIPPFSSALVVHRSNVGASAAEAMDITFSNAAGIVVSFWHYANGEKMLEPIPIPAGITQMNVINQGANPAHMIPQFFLDF